jgi:hypothetical protein
VAYLIAFVLLAGMNARGIVEVVIALTGLRLGVLNTTTYTIVVLVALVTSVMAPPVLRHAMSRITQTDDELVRKIDHDTWDGVERVQRAVVPCRRTASRPTLRGVRADLRARRGQVTATGRCTAAPFNATVEARRNSPTAEGTDDGRASADWAGSGGEHAAGRAG